MKVLYNLVPRVIHEVDVNHNVDVLLGSGILGAKHVFEDFEGVKTVLVVVTEKSGASYLVEMSKETTVLSFRR